MKSIIWLVDDCEDIAEIKVEMIQEMRPESTVKVFLDLPSAITTEGRCHLIFVDISAISTISHVSPSAFANITQLFTKRPHLPLIVLSGVCGSFVEEILQRLKEIGFDSTVDYAIADLNMKTHIKRILDQYLPLSN